jgi:tRNA (cmo5U34)-methyltransferase
MPTSRMAQVARHFNSEAGAFDDRVVKIIPCYQEMLTALVGGLLFPSGQKIRVLDLGCGTGTVAQRVKRRFPNARIRCVDLAPAMLALAADKLRGVPGIEFERADLQHYVPAGPYDAVVSSLALHHLATDADKRKVHRRIYRALVPGGVFVNADITVSPQEAIQGFYLRKWAEYIRKSFSQAELKRNHRRYQREDRPAVLLREITRLRQIGFRQLEILWKYYNFATYAAYK